MRAILPDIGAEVINSHQPTPQQVEAVYAQALKISDAEQRDSFIKEACAKNHALLEHVRRLFVLHDQHFSSFLEQPAGSLPLGGNIPPEILNAGLTATIGTDGYRPKTKSFSGTPKSQISLRSLDVDDSKVTKANSTEIPKSDPEGRYQFVGELGRGGMGRCSKAETPKSAGT